MWAQAPGSWVTTRGYKGEKPAGAVLPYTMEGQLDQELINSIQFTMIHVDGIHTRVGNRIIIMELTRFGPILAVCRPYFVNTWDERIGRNRKVSVHSHCNEVRGDNPTAKPASYMFVDYLSPYSAVLACRHLNGTYLHRMDVSVCMVDRIRKLESGKPGVFVEEEVYNDALYDVHTGDGVNDIYNDLEDVMGERQQ